MKDVCFIWDVEMSQLNFITQLVQGENLKEISVLLVLDLTQAREMWNIFDGMEKLHDKMKQNSAVQVNCGIIGMKYDLYEVIIIFCTIRRGMKYKCYLLSCCRNFLPIKRWSSAECWNITPLLLKQV